MSITLEKFISQLDESGVISAVEITAFQQSQSPAAESAEDLGKLLVKHKKVTKLQAQLVYQGKGDRLLLGNYLILDKIGAGGMGDVYLAEHRRMERRVALKTLPATMTRDTQSILRFHREVKAAAKLTHPNIVAAYDADEANGVHYFVMEYVEGIDLSAVVKKQGVLEVDVAVDYILQAAKGLEFAHNKGVIHRDIKPANLLLDNDGCVKILDMGLARIEDEAHEIPATQLTQDGSVMGTVDYMAPEQAKDTHTADARSDIYSLGCSLYYLLTGESVYRGSTMVNRIMAHQNDPIPSLTGKHILISQDVDAVFQKMVAKKPEDRFQSMSEVIVAIDNCIQMKSSSTVATEPSDPELQKFLQSQKFASSPTVVMSADAMAAEKPLTDTQNESLTSGFLNHTLGGTSYQPLAKRKQSIGKRGGIIAGVVLASLILIAGIVFKIDTPAGTIILDIDQSELTGAVVSVDEQQKITIKTGKGTEPIEVVADEKTHTLQVTKGGFETFTKQFTVKAGGKETIKVRLERLAVATKKKPSAGTPAKSHSALRFQNKSDYVTLPLKHETAGDLTVEVWVTIDEDCNPPLAYISNGTSAMGFTLDLYSFTKNGKQWSASISNKGNSRLPLPSNSMLKSGKRTNITFTYNGNVAQIYVNGHKKRELNSKGSIIHTDQFIIIGNRFPNAADVKYFKGSIDELRFSNIARYSEDFTPRDHFETDKHTMALYRFDEGSGDVLKDSSGNGHDGKIVGAKWVKMDDELQGSMVPLKVAERKVPPAGTPAKSHYALRFQNSSDLVTLPLKHETAGDLTVEAWVTIDEHSTRPLQFISNGSRRSSFSIGFFNANENKPQWHTTISNNGKYQVLPSNSKVELGKRTNIAVTYKGDVVQIYVNGHKQGEMNFKGSEIHSDQFITIGTRFKTLLPIKGSIDEVRISNIARYTEDFTPTDHFETDKNTLALYHFDEGSGDILKDASGNGHDGKIVGAKWVKVDDELQVTEPATTGEKPMTEREVAEWVLSTGGGVGLNRAHKYNTIKKLEDLPKEPFFVYLIVLNYKNVTDDGLRLLKDLTQLSMLYAKETPVTNAGMQYLAKLTSLTELDISYTSVGDEGLQYLGKLDELIFLNLQRTKITDVGTKHLANLRNLVVLNLYETKTGDNALEHIKNLIKIEDLSGGILTTDEGLKHLSQMKQLQSLALNNTQVTGSGLVHLPDPQKLVNLILQGSPVTDSGLQNVSKYTNLQVLYLRSTKITDAGLKHLEPLKQLKKLILERTRITDIGLKHLHDLKKLEDLDLRETKVTSQGIADLQKALPNCKIKSDFETKPITTSNSPMTDREIAEWVIGMGGGIGIGFKLNYKIEELPTEPVIFNSVSLKNASFEDHDLQRLAKLKTLKYLFLESTSISDTGFQYLKQMQNLEEIFLDYTKITDEGLLHLRGLQNLRVLRLSKTKITGEGLGHLKDLPRLHTIDVNRAAITNSGMKAMGDLKQLTSLNISFNSQVDDTGLGYIEGLTKLEKLFAHLVPKITDEGLKHLQGKKQLETLTLSSTGITTTGLEQLTKHESLNKLDLTNCKITDSGLEHLQDLKNLRDLRLDLTPVSDAGLQHLYSLKKLENLDLRETKVTSQGIADLQKALPKCKIESDFKTKPPAMKAP